MPKDNPDHYFDPYAYPPEFTPEDERAAQEEGYFDAYELWRSTLGGQLADEGREKMKLQAKAQGIVDLGGLGLSSADLGALSDESLHLPHDPDYRSDEVEVRAQKEPYLRYAQFVGACNRLIDIHARLDKYNLYLNMSPSDLRGDRLTVFHWAHIERGKVANTLEALGEDVEDIEARIEAGEIQYLDRIEAPNIVSDDPDIQRVEDAYREELRQTGIEVEEREELIIDLVESRPAPGKTPRLVPSQEEGPARYDETSSDDLQSRVRPGSTPHSQGSHVKDHEIALMKERLSELGQLLHDLGYTRETSIDDVAPQDRSAWGRVMAERERIGGDLAGLTENIREVDQELDEEHTIFEEESDYEYADAGEGDGGDRTPDALYESMDMEMDGEGGDAMEMDGFEGDMDGFDGMEGW